MDKTSRTEIIEIATKFYQNLYSLNPEIQQQINIDESRHIDPIVSDDEFESYKILRGEIEWALGELKKDKAPGDDGISNNLLMNSNRPEFVKEL